MSHLLDMPPNPRTDDTHDYGGEEEDMMDVNGRYGDYPVGVLNNNTTFSVMLDNVVAWLCRVILWCDFVGQCRGVVMPGNLVV